MNRKAIIIIVGIVGVILINLFYFLKDRGNSDAAGAAITNIRAGGATGFNYVANPNESFSPLNIEAVDSVNGVLIEGFPFTIRCNDPKTIKGASYEWQLNGETIQGETGAEFKYKVDYSGIYTVKVLQKPTMLFDTLSFKIHSTAELLRRVRFNYEVERLGSVYFLHDRTNYPTLRGLTRVIKINGNFIPLNESPKNITRFLSPGANTVAIAILENGREVSSSWVSNVQIGSAGSDGASVNSGSVSSQPSSSGQSNPTAGTTVAVNGQNAQSGSVDPNNSSSSTPSPSKAVSYSFDPIRVCATTGQTEKSSGSIGITPKAGAGKKVELQEIKLVSTKSGPVSIKLVKANGDLIATSQTFLNSGINDVLLFDLYADLDNNQRYILRFDAEEEDLKIQIYYFNCFDYDFPNGAELKLDGDHFFSELSYLVK